MLPDEIFMYRFDEICEGEFTSKMMKQVNTSLADNWENDVGHVK